MATEFRSPVPLPHIPDDLSIPQFILRGDPLTRPTRPSTVPFFIDDASGRAVGYEEAHMRSYGLANGLSVKYGLSSDDVACLFSPNHVDYATVIWAVHALGAIVTPCNPSYTTGETAYQLAATKSVLIFVHPIFVDTVLAAADQVGLTRDQIVLLEASGRAQDAQFLTLDHLIKLGDTMPVNYLPQRFKPGEARTKLAFISFSSGTTGKPKGVAIPHYSVIANIIQMAAHYRITDGSHADKLMSPGDVALAVLPFFHIYGLVVTMHYLLFTGMSLVVVPKFNFTHFLESIARHGVTHLFLVPPQVVLLCKHPAVNDHDFRRIKFCMSGAAPLSGDLTTALSKLMSNAFIGQGYGLTESSTSICLLSPDSKYGRAGSAGVLIPGVTARVAKPDGSWAREGEPGELLVSSPSLALRYINDDEATKTTFVGGWLRTGDEVIISDLNVYIVDRIKEILKVRGFQVAPAELEGHLLQHPDVLDACVVGIPDEYNGESPMAFIVLEGKALERISNHDAKITALKADIAKHVADAKVPYKWLAGGVEFIDTIPKNPSGKILRRVLREKARVMMASRTPRPLTIKVKL